jgi:hypothetical protein
MPFKKGQSGNPKKQFSKENQPPSERKSEGKKKISRMKEALEFFAEQFTNTETLINGEEIELTFESNVAYQLLKKANKGDLHAIRLLMDIHGWEAPKKNENKHSFDLDFNKWLEDGDVVIKDDKQEIPHFEHLK